MWPYIIGSLYKFCTQKIQLEKFFKIVNRTSASYYYYIACIARSTAVPNIIHFYLELYTHTRSINYRIPFSVQFSGEIGIRTYIGTHSLYNYFCRRRITINYVKVLLAPRAISIPITHLSRGKNKKNRK